MATTASCFQVESVLDNPTVIDAALTVCDDVAIGMKRHTPTARFSVPTQLRQMRFSASRGWEFYLD